MNAEADLDRQLRAIDPHYTLSQAGRVWTCKVNTPTHVISVMDGSKLQAMAEVVARVKRERELLIEAKEN